MGTKATARVVGLTLALMVVGGGSAAAAPPPAANAAFVDAGAPVYERSAVGLRCRTLGYCAGVAETLSWSVRPRYYSTRRDEAVLVTCRTDDLTGVLGFFRPGDSVSTGWVNSSAVILRGGHHAVPECGGSL